MMEGRVYGTGVPGLDEVLLGGLVHGHTVMIEGYTGTGKTVFGESLIYAGISQFGQNGAIVTFEQLPEALYNDALSLGWDFRALERENRLRVIFISPATLLEEITAQISKVGEMLADIDARRLFIDGINMLETIERDPYRKRLLIGRVVAAFQREGLNVYFSREKPEEMPLGASPESYIADTVLQLSHVELHSRRVRSLEVIKSRGQEALTGPHTFKIRTGGTVVYPRQKVPALQPQPMAYEEERLGFGVAQLDDMLRGGVFKHSSTLVAGSAGTGKSMLCLQFLLEGARRGEPGLFVTVEEPAVQVAANARRLAPDVDQLLQSGLLRILYLSPLETDINEQILIVREALASGRVSRLAFDSLSDYAQLLPEVEYKDYVYALLSFAKGSGVTALFTTEILELTSVERITVHGTSYLLDNIILLRFVELANTLRRAIVVLKTRGSDHAANIHEYVISAQGIRVIAIDPSLPVPVLGFQQYVHILTRFPTPRQEPSEDERGPGPGSRGSEGETNGT